jgi:hypothetical protein
MLCLYNLEDVDAIEQELAFYKQNGGKQPAPSDVIRWLGQKCYERGQYERAEKNSCPNSCFARRRSATTT